MINLNLNINIIYNENQQVLVTKPSKLLAEVFNDVVFKIDKEFIHES